MHLHFEIVSDVERERAKERESNDTDKTPKSRRKDGSGTG